MKALYINLSDQEFDEVKKQAETHLAGIQGEFREKKIESKSHVIYGSVVEGIINIAAQEDVDLIALASHGRGGSCQSFLRQCCRRTIASGGPPPVDYQIPQNGIKGE